MGPLFYLKEILYFCRVSLTPSAIERMGEWLRRWLSVINQALFG